MANTKKNQKNSVSYDCFGGIDHTERYGDPSFASDSVNFRILKDGSLKKRCGFRLFASFDYTVRALFSTVENGIQRLYVLSGNKVLAVSASTGERFLIGTVETDSGHGLFFTYNGIIYLMDGHKIYKIINGSLIESKGYVPLIGDNWPNNSPGPVNESRNIITRRARITYTVGPMYSIYLPTKYPVESVEAVYFNGTLIDPEDYRIDDEFTTINVPGIEPGNQLEIYFTYKEAITEKLAGIMGANTAISFSGSKGSGVLLSGAINSGKVFCTKQADKNNLERAQKHFPDSDDLYFPEDYFMQVGSGVNDIRSMCLHQEKMLIFTSADVWMSYPDSIGTQEFPATGVNSEIGCPIFVNGAVSTGNKTVSAGAGSIWMWVNDSASANNCKGENISSPIEDELELVGIENCGLFFDSIKSELWVYSLISDVCWIYNTDLKKWYKFTNISADKMLLIEGNVAFVNGRNLFIFKNDLKLDYDEYSDGYAIHASYSTCLTDLSTDKRKNLSSITLKGDLCGHPITVRFEGDNGEIKDFSFVDESSNEYSVITKRVTSGRFQCATFRFETSAPVCQTVKSFTVRHR